MSQLADDLELTRATIPEKGLREWLTARKWLVALVSIIALVAALLAYQFGGTLIGLPVTIIIAAISLIGAVISQSLGLRNQRLLAIDAENRRQQIEIEARLRERKAEVYSAFVGAYINLFLSPDYVQARKGQAPDAAIREMLTFTPDLMLWGSNDVVEAYVDLRSAYARAAQNGDTVTGEDGMTRLGRLVLTMRTEMGHDPDGMHEDILLDLFINDWRGHRKRLAAQRSTD